MRFINNLLLVLLFFSKVTYAQTGELKLLITLNKNEHAGWDKGMRGITNSVYPIVPISILGIWADGYFKKDVDKKRNAYKSALCIGIAMATTSGLKFSVNRERPFAKHPSEIIQRDTHVGPYSFPSGHTTSAFATATALSLSYKKWYVTSSTFLYASFVGYSRMRLGVHYPSDVLAGAVIGMGSGFLTWKLNKIIFGK